MSVYKYFLIYLYSYIHYFFRILLPFWLWLLTDNGIKSFPFLYVSSESSFPLVVLFFIWTMFYPCRLYSLILHIWVWMPFFCCFHFLRAFAFFLSFFSFVLLVGRLMLFYLFLLASSYVTNSEISVSFAFFIFFSCC